MLIFKNLRKAQAKPGYQRQMMMNSFVNDLLVTLGIWSLAKKFNFHRFHPKTALS
jgi:hypothetical protein